ncbi:MAG TPA: MiaB/RimO family radical SAM methylthiotransferase [Gemmatimonadaceae bacterium]|jgi:threonylcarbamoyladenosine tRNA methylthiotransferase MtaB|nr:MiaB/RimO family radical SAM methylthiotransferase [Gemmatimonadaceae bacterium]
MKAYLRTFGCRANQYDTEAARAMIEAAGGTIVETPEEADVALFNSCAVTSAAEADLRQEVRRASRGNRALRSIVIGCASARDDGTIAALPAVSDVIGGADLTALAMALGIDPIAALTRPALQTGSRALLRIQDGCDEHCTFCATTLARGANRSRPADEIVREAAALAAEHPEIVVTGIHIGTYGADTGSSLGELLERLVAEVPRARFRLTSVEATEVDARLAELLIADPRRVAPHLHAPLQSGSDRVLKRMGRHWYSAASYARAAAGLAGRAAVFALGADVITGFPGETDEDHAATVALVTSLPFTYLHVFPYSARPGTAAVRMNGEVPAALSRARSAELRAIGETKAAAHRAARADGTADVIVVGDGAKREGLTEDYLTVALDDPSIPRRTRFTAHIFAGSGGRLSAVRHPPSAVI